MTSYKHTQIGYLIIVVTLAVLAFFVWIYTMALAEPTSVDSGPNFAIEKEDSLKIEARKKAIDDAKTKAESLANDLGIKLRGIISFNCQIHIKAFIVKASLSRRNFHIIVIYP